MEYDYFAILKEVRAALGAFGQGGWRPFLGWSLALSACIGAGAYCIAIGFAAVRAAFQGVPMPDMSGGLGPMVIALGGALIGAGGRGVEKWARDNVGALTGGFARGPGVEAGAA